MYSLRLFLKSRIVFAATLVLTLASFGSIWYVLAKIPKNIGQVFLHYNIIFGVDWVGDSWLLWFLPGGILLAALVNFIFAWMLYRTEKLFATFLLVGGVLAMFVGVYALYLVVGLNA